MEDTHAAPRNLFRGSFWAILDPAEQALVRKAGTVRRFERGESLCRQGDLSRHVYVLLRGSIEIVTDVATGYESVLAVRGPGDIAGEFAAIDGRPRSATMRALDPVEAIVVPVERFAVLCQSRSRLAWMVLLVVVDRLRDISYQRAEHRGRLVRQRLAALLVELAGRYGVVSGDGVTIAVPLTQKGMAGMIAASRESVVRVLRDLRRQRVITTGRRRVTILRLDSLERLISWPRTGGE